MKKYNVTVYANNVESENWEIEAKNYQEAYALVLEEMNIIVEEIEE